jgi:hypothetical protein
MQYRFKLTRHPYAKGDRVPESFSKGTIATMLAYGRIEPIREAVKAEPPTEPEKSIPAAPADKMLRPNRVKVKGGAA